MSGRSAAPRAGTGIPGPLSGGPGAAPPGGALKRGGATEGVLPRRLFWQEGVAGAAGSEGPKDLECRDELE
jgi:hypothetical protein